MSGLGRKVFNSGDILLASEVQGYLQDQAVMVFDTAAARGSAIPTPTEGMVTFRKDDDAVEVFDGTDFVSLGGVGAAVVGTVTGSPTITSGTVISGETYDLYDFTGSGSVVFDSAGFADILLIGGGGAGGRNDGSQPTTHVGSGGGAGGYLEKLGAYFPTGTATVTVGAGGAIAFFKGVGRIGNSSRLGDNFVTGGGGGGNGVSSTGPALPGGSGGGSNGAGIEGLGNNGGSHALNSGGAGGGGAGAVGVNGSSGTGGAGGAGTSTSITGSAVTYAGGGGGGAQSTGGAGGAGGGGAGTVSGTAGSGTANTGGGGGGARNGTAGAGGSGKIIVRVKV